MKKLLFILLFPLFLFSNETPKVSSKIKAVTVYLSGAQITRTANCNLNSGTSEIIFTGLSPKIDESSIQITGLNDVSILSMAYDLNFLAKAKSNPEVVQFQDDIAKIDTKIVLLQNQILGLQEEENVITTNRQISAQNKALDLEQLKQISTYYRERITAIKNEVSSLNNSIIDLKDDKDALEGQLNEINNIPEKEQGELKIKFDAPIATNMQLTIKYTIKDAGWIPTYDIKSKQFNDPLQLKYKAHVYQKSGTDWNDVKVTLSTGNPNINVEKPVLAAHYLNFVSKYDHSNFTAKKKEKYFYNPTVKRVIGRVSDASGLPLPGVNIVIAGTNVGTQTDFDGNYAIDISRGQRLIFSYLGSKTEELPIYSSLMNLRLEEDASQLEEVVVMGYGTTGSSSRVKVRGMSSVQANSEPLYIVDGVPLNGFTMGDLDKNEIQSIDILQDASSTAIYGSRGANGVVVITTKKSSVKEDFTNTQFIIKKTFNIPSDGDITAIEINTFSLDATYEHFAAPIINENVFLTASFKDWEQYNLLPGEANIYFEGGYAGKTSIDPYTTKKEMTLSLGIDPNITVSRKQDKNFKSKSFTGSNRVLERTYTLEVKNNKATAIDLKLMDRIPLSQNKDIKIDNIETYNADYDKLKGILSWNLKIASKESKNEKFSFKIKYPKYKHISL